MRKKDITKEILNDEEFMEIVTPILEHPEFLKRKNWQHHEHSSLYEHCLAVSYLSYKVCKKHKWHYKDAAIAGLLHDFYTKPWQENLSEKKPFFKQHGFVHASEALDNSRKYFSKYLNPRIENSIVRHMFPLNIKPPRYIEGWVVSYADKRLSLDVVVDVKAWPKYLGLTRKINHIKKIFKRK